MSDILIVEDNADIAEGLRANLDLEGYSVETCATGEQGLQRIRERPPRLVILDLLLPGADGFHVLRRLRDEGFTMPVLMLWALGGETEKVRGLRISADDYVTKPFSLREVLARVDVLFRRRPPPPPAERQHALPVERATFGAEEIVALRPREYDLLWALVERAGTVVSRDELLHRVWGYDDDVVTRTVDTHVVELRRKLEPDPARPRHIVTVRKAGYLLQRS